MVAPFAASLRTARKSLIGLDIVLGRIELGEVAILLANRRARLHVPKPCCEVSASGNRFPVRCTVDGEHGIAVGERLTDELL
jgi:hypothetical protein